MRMMKTLFFVLTVILLSFSLQAQVASGSGIVSSGNGLVFGNNSPNCTITTASLPGGVSGAAYSQSIATTNCTGPINWSVISGTLPPGLSLTTPTAGTVGTLSGTLGAAGTYSFTVQALDANGRAGVQAYTVTISPACSITTTSLPNGQTTVAYSQTLAYANCVSPLVWNISAGSLPTGLSIGSVSGTISGTPTVAGTFSFTAQVTDTNSHVGTQNLSITINASTPFSVTTASLPGGTVGSPYSQSITTSNGTAPLTWGLQAGSAALPPGLSLTTPTAGTTGTISGNPTTAGTYPFTIKVTDNGGNVATQPFSLVISALSGDDNTYCTPSGTWIGPTTDNGAQMPTVCMNTAVSNTPSPGTLRGPDSTLAALQADVNAAACGDVIQVAAGSIMTGTLSLPAKGCDNTHWITIESTGVSNANFPTEGVRMTPCWAGVASMPNRPSYPCPSPLNLMFKLITPASSNGLRINGGDHYRIMGMELTRVTTAGVPIYNLADLTSTIATQTNNIIFDRSWVHGVNADGSFPQTSTTDTSTTRGIYLGQSNHIAFINSYCSDFYDNSSTASNGNTDAQCIGGGVGGVANSGWGVYKIVNDHIEASGEGILLGGGGGPQLTPAGCTIMVNCNLDVPTDIEVRRDYFFKPLSWQGTGGVGWPAEKNGFEMKIGARALFEGNVIENTWYQAQVGWCWSTAPKNQSGGSPSHGTAPTALTNDFTYRYNYCYHTAYGLGLYQSMDSGCTSCQAQGANRVVVHDNIVNDAFTNTQSCCTGDEMSLTAAPDSTNQGLNKLQNIVITHNTFVKGLRYMLGFGASSTGQYINFTYQNNIANNAQYGVGANPSTGGCDGSGGATFYFLLTNCATGWTADHNAVFNMSGVLGSGWPTNGSGAGNFFYNNTAGPGFVNYGTGDSGFNPGNYSLTSSSPLHNAASDGTDLGADITTLQTKISGVRQ